MSTFYHPDPWNHGNITHLHVVVHLLVWTFLGTPPPFFCSRIFWSIFCIMTCIYCMGWSSWPLHVDQSCSFFSDFCSGCRHQYPLDSPCSFISSPLIKIMSINSCWYILFLFQRPVVWFHVWKSTEMWSIWKHHGLCSWFQVYE